MDTNNVLTRGQWRDIDRSHYVSRSLYIHLDVFIFIKILFCIQQIPTNK